jgi:hypothetical protein
MLARANNIEADRLTAEIRATLMAFNLAGKAECAHR